VENEISNSISTVVLTQGIPDLNRLPRLRAGRAKLHERRAELRSTAAGLHSPLLDGMPKEDRGINRKVERTAVMLADLDAAIQRYELDILRAECELQRFISTVPNSRLRLIIRHRFIDNLAWNDVAKAISRTETAAAVKASFRRFMDTIVQNPI